MEHFEKFALFSALVGAPFFVYSALSRSARGWLLSVSLAILSFFGALSLYLVSGVNLPDEVRKAYTGLVCGQMPDLRGCLVDAEHGSGAGGDPRLTLGHLGYDFTADDLIRSAERSDRTALDAYAALDFRLPLGAHTCRWDGEVLLRIIGAISNPNEPICVKKPFAKHATLSDLYDDLYRALPRLLTPYEIFAIYRPDTPLPADLAPEIVPRDLVIRPVTAAVETLRARKSGAAASSGDRVDAVVRCMEEAERRGYIIIDQFRDDYFGMERDLAARVRARPEVYADLLQKFEGTRMCTPRSAPDRIDVGMELERLETTLKRLKG